MPEYVLQLWAAMVFSSATPYSTLCNVVPLEHRPAVRHRAWQMSRRILVQEIRAGRA